MMTHNYSFCGISFSYQRKPTTERVEQIKKLSQLLFINPSISVKEIKEILDSKKLMRKINQLIKLMEEQINESLHKSEIDENWEEILHKKFVIKLYQWSKYFGDPSNEDLDNAISEYELPEFLKSQLLRYKFKRIINDVESIYNHLSQYVKGQNEALHVVSSLIYEHNNIIKLEDNTIQRSFALMIGKSGSGKSYLLKHSSHINSQAMITINLAGVVPAGIKGISIANYLTELYKYSREDLEIMSKAMIHLDEMDKIAFANDNLNFGIRIQYELLKFFDDGVKIYFPNNFTENEKMLFINSSKLLVVATGAFTGIDAIIYKRLKELYGNERLIDKDNLMLYCTNSDLQEYGIIRELAARFNSICTLNNFTEEDFIDIMNAKNSILQKMILNYKYQGIKIQFTDEAIAFIAKKAVEENTGARSISRVVNSVINNLKFKFFSQGTKEFVIDKKDVAATFAFHNSHPLYQAFKQNIDFMTIAKKFNLSLDQVIEFYNQWKISR